jgi:hypothetical protein
MRKWLTYSFLAALLSAGLVFGTNTGCDDAEAAFDCQSVCDRYKTCFDSTYDVGMCRSRCRAASENDPGYRQRADTCEDCIDQGSCAANAFNCAIPCATIVPGP